MTDTFTSLSQDTCHSNSQPSWESSIPLKVNRDTSDGRRLTKNDLISDIDVDINYKGCANGGIQSQFSPEIEEYGFSSRNGVRPDILQNEKIWVPLMSNEKCSGTIFDKPCFEQRYAVKNNRLPHIMGRTSENKIACRSYLNQSKSFQESTRLNTRSDNFRRGYSMYSADAFQSIDTCDNSKLKNNQSFFTSSDMTSDEEIKSQFAAQREITPAFDKDLLPFDVPTNFPPPPVRKKLPSFFSRTALKLGRKKFSKQNTNKRYFTSKQKKVSKGINNKIDNDDRTDTGINIRMRCSNISQLNDAIITSTNNDCQCENTDCRKSIPISSTPLNGFQLMKSRQYHNFKPCSVSSCMRIQNNLTQNASVILPNGTENTDSVVFSNSIANLDESSKVIRTENVNQSIPERESTLHNKVDGTQFTITRQFDKESDNGKENNHQQNDNFLPQFKINRSSESDRKFDANTHSMFSAGPQLEKSSKITVTADLPSQTIKDLYNFKFENRFDDLSRTSSTSVQGNGGSSESGTPTRTPNHLMSLLSPKHLSQPHINAIASPLVYSFENSANCLILGPHYTSTGRTVLKLEKNPTKLCVSSSLIEYSQYQVNCLHAQKTIASIQPVGATTVVNSHHDTPRSSTIPMLSYDVSTFPLDQTTPRIPRDTIIPTISADSPNNCDSPIAPRPVTANESLCSARTLSCNAPLLASSIQYKSLRTKSALPANSSSKFSSSEISSNFTAPPKDLKVDTSAVATSVMVSVSRLWQKFSMYAYYKSSF